MPFQWYKGFNALYVLLNPLCPCLSCASISRQSFSTSGTTVGVYSMPFMAVFFFKILSSIVKCFLSSFFSHHCFLRRLTNGSCSCNSFILVFVRGSSISMSLATGLFCLIFSDPGNWSLWLSLMMTSSIMVTLAGGSSLKVVCQNSYPDSSSGKLMLSSNSINLLKVSVRTFLVPAINLKLMFCDSSSTAQLFTSP